MFENPIFFILLLLIPLMIWLKFSKKRHIFMPYSNVSNIKNLKASFRVKIYKLFPYIYLLILILLVIAIAGPQTPVAFVKRNKDVVDIELLIDVSTSMNAIDLSENNKKLNRLESAKIALKEFIEKRPDDRLGLIAFAAMPYNVSPLTLDHDWLLTQLNRLKTGMLEDGTAIGSAISSAISRLKNSDAKSKIIILLTDGSNNAGKIEPMDAAKTAKALGIKIYTIGAGSNGVALIPVYDVFGDIRYVRQRVVLNDNILKQIAEATGGKYFRATDLEKMKEIYKEIDKMERTKVKEESYFEYEKHYKIFTLFTILLLITLSVLNFTKIGRLP
jgi:Ca-activated chloride channel family protein